MKKKGLLNPQLVNTIASLGHTDTVCIADAGLPIPESTNRIDLTLTYGVPSFIETLTAILQETHIESVYLAEEIKIHSIEMLSKIQSILKQIPITYISHDQFKQNLTQTKGIVRTGECTPYANIMLVSGVPF